jgi:twitching motility protein PilI
MAQPALSQSPFEVLTDYEQRSLAHVAGMPEQIEAPGLWRGIGFRIGTRHLASGFGEVVEIITLPPVTPVPGGDNWLLGVANIRSTLLPVVDLKLFMEGERTVLHETTRALVVRQTGGNVAVLIDELYGQRNFTDENRAELSGIDEGRYSSFVKSAYQLGDVLWGVFSMTLLTRTPEFRQAAAA